MDDKRSKVINTHQSKIGSHWLNVGSCKNLGLKLDDQQLRISIGLLLGAKICIAHTCHCGKRVERDGVHGISCTKSAGSFSRHSQFSHKADVGISRMPSMLQPRGLDIPDGKRPNGVTMIPWEMGKQLVWDVTFECSCTQSLDSRLLMQPGNHRHRG